jgi:adenylosuccinate synthase
VSSLAHLIFPWHQAIDAALELARGDSKIGTTLKGIGPAYVDKVKRSGIRVGEVLNPRVFEEKVRERAIAARREVSDIGGDTFDVEQVVAEFVAYAERLAPYVADTVNLLHDAREKGESILLEGAQATFLDVDHGTYPYVTSSNPTSGGAAVGSGLGPRHIDRVVGIAKAYTTRVGMGPFPSELTDALGEALVDIGREYGTVTGRRRRTGWLDTVMLRHATRLNSLTEIALTKLDVLDTFDEVKVCVGYRINGEIIKNYPDTVERLAQVEPVWETLPGWKSSTEGITSFDALPESARALVAIVERETGIPVSMVGTGPSRDAMVVRS